MSQPFKRAPGSLAPPGSGITTLRDGIVQTILDRFEQQPDALKGLVGVVVDAILNAHVESKFALNALGEWRDGALSYDLPSGRGYVLLGLFPAQIPYADLGTYNYMGATDPGRAKLEADPTGTRFRFTLSGDVGVWVNQTALAGLLQSVLRAWFQEVA